MDMTLLSALNAERAARRGAILVTSMVTGEQRLIHRDIDYSTDPLSEELSKRFLSGKSGIVTANEGNSWFLTVSVPPPRLIIIGAVHISQTLAPMAEMAGFDVAIVDPRTAFATKGRFTTGALHADWPEDVLKSFPLDAYTAVAAVTHDPKIDDFPLQQALKTRCFYVGALGSRKTHAKRVERFVSAGFNDTEISRIDAPIGLDIGASSPSEIAVAVLANIIAALRKAS